MKRVFTVLAVMVVGCGGTQVSPAPPPAPPADPAVCIADGCDASQACGPFVDRCGGVTTCGGCSDGLVCGAESPHQCGAPSASAGRVSWAMAFDDLLTGFDVSANGDLWLVKQHRLSSDLSQFTTLIERRSTDGALQQSIPVHEYGWFSLGVSPLGNLFLFGNTCPAGWDPEHCSKLIKLDPDGTVLWEQSVDDRAVALAVDSHGNAVVLADDSARNHWLRKFSPDGRELFEEQLSVIVSLASASGDRIAVGGTAAGDPLVVSDPNHPAGVPHVATPFMGLLDADGHVLWVANAAGYVGAGYNVAIGPEDTILAGASGGSSFEWNGHHEGNLTGYLLAATSTGQPLWALPLDTQAVPMTAATASGQLMVGATDNVRTILAGVTTDGEVSWLNERLPGDHPDRMPTSLDVGAVRTWWNHFYVAGPLRGTVDLGTGPLQAEFGSYLMRIEP